MQSLSKLFEKSILAICFIFIAGVFSQTFGMEDDSRIKNLEEEIEILTSEIENLKTDKNENKKESGSWYDRTSIGGYGEIHYNNNLDSKKSYADIHRLVLYLNHEVNDWISLNSETELEHAYVQNEKGNGELLIEQLFADFSIRKEFNIKAGRILVPVGIVNLNHEPTLFNGVERPSVETYIIPTTWHAEGLGPYGNITDNLSYELYLVNSLDGSKVDAINGFRNARQKERPGYNEPALTGRLDYSYLFNTRTNYSSSLRTGLSFFCGGLDNGNKGSENGIDAALTVLAADFDYSLHPFDLRGLYSTVFIDNPENIGEDVADEMRGWYIEAGWHILPESWKNGRLSESDCVLFARFEDYDTQSNLSGSAMEVAGSDREDITVGLSFFFTPNFVIKADYQKKDEKNGQGVEDYINLGIGWVI